MQTIPEQIAYIGQLMFERNLTDIAGGNISAREGDKIYITPRYAGSKWHWHLAAEEILSGPINTDELADHPSFSREGISHLGVYRAFPEAQAIIHAHPPYVLAFCVAEKPIHPVLNAVQKYGTLTYIDHTPPYSQEQADSIIANLRGKEELIQKAAAAVLMPQHGIFIAGKDLWAAIDALERINTNAMCVLAQKML